MRAQRDIGLVLESGDDVDRVAAHERRVRPIEGTPFPTELVYGNTDNAALRRITCGGPFDHPSGHYTDNVIVFASLGGSVPAS